MHRVGVLVMAVVLALAAAPAARAQDSDAPPGALPHWLPTEQWVYQHWLPYDEARLERVLGVSMGAIFRHLRNDLEHNLAQLARRRGMTPRQAAIRLVAPRRGRTRAISFRQLVDRAERTLTQGHLSQHILFHTMHQLAIPDRARWIFGTPSVEAYLARRRAELSPQQIGRLHGRTQAQMLARTRAALRREAAKGVASGAVTARQARLLLSRQLSQVPRFLGQQRYNGPPKTVGARQAKLPPNDYANNPTITADGAAVVFDQYRATIPEAKRLGEIRVLRFDVAAGRRAEVSHAPQPADPRSAYNSAVSADGSTVVFEQALGNRTFGKRYGHMQVLARVLGQGVSRAVSHRGGESTFTAYNPSVSADGRLVAYETSDGALAVRDTGTGERTTLGSGAVFESVISGDGRTVAFTAADGRSVVFLRDVATRATTLVARDARDPAVSHDGGVVVFARGTGDRSVLAAREDGRTRALTRPADGRVREPALSPDGRFVAYVLQRRGRARVHLLDRATGRVRQVSGPGASEPAVSADGTRVAYTTTARLRGKPHGTPGVVLADLAAGTRRLLSTHAPIKAGPGHRPRAAAVCALGGA
jgi:Tol biopolymer transport system component